MLVTDKGPQRQGLKEIGKVDDPSCGLRKTRHTCLYVHGWETEFELGGHGSRRMVTKSGVRRWRDFWHKGLGLVRRSQMYIDGEGRDWPGS